MADPRVEGTPSLAPRPWSSRCWRSRSANPRFSLETGPRPRLRGAPPVPPATPGRMSGGDPHSEANALRFRGAELVRRLLLRGEGHAGSRLAARTALRRGERGALS